MTSRPMSPQDSLWLLLDRPTNLMAITSVLWTSEPIDPDRLRALVRERLLDRYPVFRRRAVLGGRLLRSARWEDDPEFDLDRHLLVREMPAPGDRAALQEYVAALRSVPLDPARPLWTVHLLQGYGGGSAVVQRYHHAMADGIRLTQVMLGMLDPVDGSGPATVAARSGFRPGHFDAHLAEHVADGLASRTVGLLRRTGGGRLLDLAGAAAAALPPALPRLPASLARPGRLVDTVVNTTFDAGLTMLNSAGSVVKLLRWSNAPTALSGQPGVAKTAVWADPVPLTLLRRIGRATGTTVNDVCLALVAGTVARYLEQRRPGAAPGDLGWMVPVNLEPFDAELPRELGNHFALVLAVLPHGIRSFRERLAEVHRRVGRIRDSYEPLLTFVTQASIARSPRLLADRLSAFFTGKTVGVLTNVPGPRAPMALAGAPVEGVVGWAPCSGQQAITVCIFSYAGQVLVGFGTDRTLLPDPERLVAAFDAEVAAATSQTAVAAVAERSTS